MDTEDISRVLVNREVLDSIRKCYSWANYCILGRRENSFIVDGSEPPKIGKVLPTSFELKKVALEESKRYKPNQDEYFQPLYDFSRREIGAHIDEYRKIHGTEPNQQNRIILTRWRVVESDITNIPEAHSSHPYLHRVLLTIFDYFDLCELTARYPKAILVSGSVEKRNQGLVNLVILKQRFPEMGRDPAFLKQSIKMDMLGIDGRQQELIDSYPLFARQRVEEAIGYERVCGMMDLKHGSIVLDPSKH